MAPNTTRADHQQPHNSQLHSFFSSLTLHTNTHKNTPIPSATHHSTQPLLCSDQPLQSLSRLTQSMVDHHHQYQLHLSLGTSAHAHYLDLDLIQVPYLFHIFQVSHVLRTDKERMYVTYSTCYLYCTSYGTVVESNIYYPLCPVQYLGISRQWRVGVTIQGLVALRINSNSGSEITILESRRLCCGACAGCTALHELHNPVHGLVLMPLALHLYL